MAQFSRRTLLEACNLFGEVLRKHAPFEGLMLRWELDDLALVSNRSLGLETRCLNLFRYLREHPEARCDDRDLRDLVVEEAATYVFDSDPDQKPFFAPWNGMDTRSKTGSSAVRYHKSLTFRVLTMKSTSCSIVTTLQYPKVISIKRLLL